MLTTIPDDDHDDQCNWKTLNDPLSLQSFSKIGYAPFKFYDSKTQDIYFFDGKVLALFIAATESFRNPFTGTSLTKKNCEEIDSYLLENGQNMSFSLCQIFCNVHAIDSDNTKLPNRHRQDALEMLRNIVDKTRPNIIPNETSENDEIHVNNTLWMEHFEKLIYCEHSGSGADDDGDTETNSNQYVDEGTNLIEKVNEDDEMIFAELRATRKRQRQEWLQREHDRRQIRKYILSIVFIGFAYFSGNSIKNGKYWRVGANILAWIVTSVCCGLLVDRFRKPIPARHLLSTSRMREDDYFGITLLALGTRGDVDPLLTLAKHLQTNMPNVKVLVCAPGDFKQCAYRLGVPFASCGVKSIVATQAWQQATSLSAFLKVAMHEYMKDFDMIATGFWKACCENDDNRYHRTDAIIASTYALNFGHDIAETLCIPCWAFRFAPEAPTKSMPPFGEKPWTCGIFNKTRYYSRAVAVLGALKAEHVVDRHNVFRAQALDLPELTLDDLNKLGPSAPSLCAFSPSLIPRPRDWHSNQFVTGFCLMDQDIHQDDLTRLGEINAFCAASSEKPICINFGSMSFALWDKDQNFEESLLFKCFEAIRMLGRPCIVVGMKTSPVVTSYMSKNPQSVLFIDAIAHDLLFPKCACIIHHGGAGTTGRVVRAAVPSLIIPVLAWYDQRGWGLVLERRQLGICLDQSEIKSPIQIFDALLQLTLHPTFSESVCMASRNLHREDGVQNALESLLKCTCSDEIGREHCIACRYTKR